MLGWIVETTVIAAGIALVVSLTSRLFSVGPAVRHAMWLVVLIKLITPPLISWPWAPQLGSLDWPVAMTRTLHQFGGIKLNDSSSQEMSAVHRTKPALRSVARNGDGTIKSGCDF